MFIRNSLVVAGLLAVAVAFGATFAQSQERAAAQKYEVAVIKFDGPDRIAYILPGNTQKARITDEIEIPKGVHDEAFCLAVAANKLAKDGWEPVSIDGTRIMMKRAVK
ncbi:MAG TPA: hypothetical protein VGH19_19835 [Verrucomicrobiae bacterium]